MIVGKLRARKRKPKETSKAETKGKKNSWFVGEEHRSK